METQKDKSNNIELRSEKVRNIIGQIPPFLVRSGIGVITLVIVILLAVCYFIPYYETAAGEVEICSVPASEVYLSPGWGTAVLMPKFDRSGALSVERRDTVCEVSMVDSTVEIVSNMSGRLSLNIEQDNPVNEGDVLFAVTPDSITGIYGQLILPYEYRDKIKMGQSVKIELTGYPSNIYGVLRGTIGKIYPLAVTTNSSSNVQTATADSVNLSDVKPVGPTFLKVKIILPQGLTTSDGRKLHFTPALRGTANIILSKHSLLMRMFGR